MLLNRSPVRLASIVLLALDTALVLTAWALAFWLRFNLEVPDEFVALALDTAPLAIASYWVALLGFGVHRQVCASLACPNCARSVLPCSLRR